MVSQNIPGGAATRSQRVYHINLHGSDLESDLRWAANTEPEAFTRLVETLSEGNHAIKGALLRRWGVRR